MILFIAGKEIRGHVFSLRFLLTILLTASLMTVSSFVFVGKYRQSLGDFREMAAKNQANLSEVSGKLCEVAFREQPLQIEPSAMELVSEGSLKLLPNTFRINIFQIGSSEIVKRANPMIPDLADVDWTFVVSLILSFFALLLVYDAVTGEKAAGTLRLVQSNSISRTSIILGKYLGAMVTLAIPLLFSFLLSLLVAVLYGRIVLTPVEIAQLGLFFLASLLYLSVFVLIGLFVSGRTATPVTSIIYLLLFWVILVILIPHSGGTIAARLFPIPTNHEIMRQIEEKRNEISTAHKKRYDKTFNWNGDPRAEWVPYRSRAVNEMADARNSIMNEYLYRMIGQVEKARKVIRISPAVVFASLAEGIAGTGVNRFKEFYRQVNDYSQQLKAYIYAKDREDPDSPHQINEWHRDTMSGKPVEFSSIPLFEEKGVSLDKSLRDCLFDFGFLALFNLLFFSLAYVAYLRYDVR